MFFSNTTNFRYTTNYSSGGDKPQLRKIRRKDLIYPALCYKIVGILFDVYNEGGAGHKEKYYQRAIALALSTNGIAFKREVYIPLRYRQTEIGRYFLDFLVADKIVLEIKRGEHFPPSNIKQIYAYLKATGLQLGILVNFTKTGVKFKRIVNVRDYE